MGVADPRLFDTDPLTGITEYFHYDPDTEGFTIQTQQDVEHFVEVNKALWNGAESSTPYTEWTRVASIPNVVLMELAKQGILSPTGAIEDVPRFKRWLNDSANRAFRTRPGRV